MSHSVLVYVVMLTYNHCEDTLRALDSLSRMLYPNYRILLVDNHSTDETEKRVREAYPDVELLVHSSNLGFAAGVNSGIEYAISHGAGFILVINNDVIVGSSMLTHLVAAMEPGVGVAAPMIYYLDDPKRVWSIGFSRHPLLLEMRGGARGKIDRGRWHEPFEVDYLLGCAMLLDSSMLEEVGFFDERYYFYREDFDFSLRVQQQGYRLITVPKAKMWHKVACSAGVSSAFRTYHMARGSVIFLRTHARGLQRPASFLFRTGSALKNSFAFTLKGQFTLLRHYWRGLRDGWRSFDASPARSSVHTLSELQRSVSENG